MSLKPYPRTLSVRLGEVRLAIGTLVVCLQVALSVLVTSWKGSLGDMDTNIHVIPVGVLAGLMVSIMW